MNDKKEEKKEDFWKSLWIVIKIASIQTGVFFFWVGKIMFEFTMIVGELFNSFFSEPKKKTKKRKKSKK